MRIFKGSIGGSGGGTIGGSVGTNQIPFGVSPNVVNGNADLTWNNGTKAFRVNGSVEVDKRLLGSSASIASANDLTLGAANLNIVSGAVQINAITTAGWTAGSQMVLLFQGALTVKNNTAGGAGTAKILLSGGFDLVTAANTVLMLVYDGTQFQEIARKAP